MIAKMIPRRNVNRSVNCLLSEEPESHTSQQRYMRKNRQQFGPQQLTKFEKWFNALDSNDNGLVSADELCHVFLSSGIMKRKKDVINMFLACDIDKSKGLTFDEFIIGVKLMTTTGKLKYSKLDSLVDECNALTTETILSQQRRNLLMHHVVTAAEMRQLEVDRVWASHQPRGHVKRVSYVDLTSSRKGKKSLEAVSKCHSRYMEKAKDIVNTLQPIVLRTSQGFQDPYDATKTRPTLTNPISSTSMQSLEDIVPPDLIALMDPMIHTDTLPSPLSRRTEPSMV